MIIIEPQGGLTNRMRVIASGLWLRDQGNRDIWCNWQIGEELLAPFEDLFESIEGLSFCSSWMRHTLIQASINRVPWKQSLAGLINRSQGIDFCLTERDFVRNPDTRRQQLVLSALHHTRLYLQTCQCFGGFASYLCAFKPVHPLRHQVDEITRRFDAHTIGIHIRRTDHKRAIVMSPDHLFVQKIERTIAKDNAVNFFLATDSPAVEHRLRETFGPRIMTHSKDFNRQSLTGVKDAVVDLYCLSKTNLIWGSFWSSFSDLAARIGRIPLITLSQEATHERNKQQNT